MTKLNVRKISTLVLLILISLISQPTYAVEETCGYQVHADGQVHQVIGADELDPLMKLVKFESKSYFASEGETLMIPVERTGQLSEHLIAGYAIEGISADFNDFGEGWDTSVKFEPNENVKFLEIHIFKDDAIEDNETFLIHLTNVCDPDTSIGNPSSVQITISDESSK